ncbi:MAG: linear amide C-N hydrolase, partial [Chitinophagaceae bacterium]
DKRPAIGVLQWIQYQLDNCSTIEEVIATDAKLRISITATPLHYLIADAKGNAATIEFLDGKMKVHKGSQLPFPVLTNDTYERSVMSKNKGTYNGDNSLERFSTACNMIQQYKANPNGKSLVDQSFDILNKVSQGDFTKWSIIYDISNKKIWFKTEQFQQLRSLNFSSFDFSCKKESKISDINGPEKGDMSSLLVNFSNDLNQRILEKTLVQTSSRIVLTREQKQALLAYPDTIHCE